MTSLQCMLTGYVLDGRDEYRYGTGECGLFVEASEPFPTFARRSSLAFPNYEGHRLLCSRSRWCSSRFPKFTTWIHMPLQAKLTPNMLTGRRKA